MHNIYLLLGSNLDNRQYNISQARDLIYKRIGKIINESAIYETAAWGMPDQAPFLNQALNVTTTYKPKTLLKKLKTIEQLLGRKDTATWGPRIIDVDILFYDDIILETEELTIPHKEIENRKFTLIPLLDIAPNLVHPKKKLSINKLLTRCNDNLKVTKFAVSSSVTKPGHEDLPTALQS